MQKNYFFVILFSFNLLTGTSSLVLIILFFTIIVLKLLCKHYFSLLNTFMRIGKDPEPEPEPDPDPYLWLIDPDPAGPKHADPADPYPQHRQLLLLRLDCKGVFFFNDARSHHFSRPTGGHIRLLLLGGQCPPSASQLPENLPTARLFCQLRPNFTINSLRVDKKGCARRSLQLTTALSRWTKLFLLLVFFPKDGIALPIGGLFFIIQRPPLFSQSPTNLRCADHWLVLLLF